MFERQEYEPTLEEIEKAAAEIRRGWTPAQEERRDKLHQLGRVPYTVPIYRVTRSRELRDGSPVFTRIG